jgi:hypothetical protein
MDIERDIANLHLIIEKKKPKMPRVNPNRQNEYRPGDECPQCKHPSALDYDGLLNLHCIYCNFTIAGACT